MKDKRFEELVAPGRNVGNTYNRQKLFIDKDAVWDYTYIRSKRKGEQG